MIGARRSLDVAAWPALASFFRGYLHQDAGDDHATLEAAFDQFWGDTSSGEKAAFAREWRLLRARVVGRVWHKVGPLVSSLGAAWLPGGGSGFARLTRHIDGHIARTHQ